MKRETKVLLKELIDANNSKMWNSVVLLYRPLLTHLISDILKLDSSIVSNLDYTKVIDIMEQSGIIKDPMLIAETQKMRITANKINHRQEIVTEAEGMLASEIIKIIINTNKSGSK